jgi:hypothetical protein
MIRNPIIREDIFLFLLGRFVEIFHALEILPLSVMIVMEINMACQIWFNDALLQFSEIWLFKTGMFQDCCQDMII